MVSLERSEMVFLMTLVLRLVFVYRAIYRDPITGCNYKLLLKTTDRTIHLEEEYQCVDLVSFARFTVKGDLLNELTYIATERWEREFISPLFPSS